MRRRRRIASHGNSVLQARSARENFCSRKELLLAAHASHGYGADTVMLTLQRYCDRLARDFVTSGASAAAWNEHGPSGELEEVRVALKDPETWDRLVETYAARRRAASGARA